MPAQKKPAKKKTSPAAVIGMIAAFAVSAAAGGVAASFISRLAGDNDALFFIYLGVLFAGFLLAYFMQIVIHEAGHLVFGLMSGYRFVSFNVMGFVWQRGDDGRIHTGTMQIAGAGGQCMMAPPEYNGGDFPFTLYNLGGVLANLITAALCALLAWLIPVNALRILLFTQTVVGVALAVMNGVPFTTAAIQNDGKNLICIRRNVHARRSLWVQLAMAAELARGVRLRDMPEEWFRPFPEEAMDDALVCTMAVQNTCRLMDAGDFPAALAAIRTLLARKTGVLGIYRTTMTCDGAVCELIAGQAGEFAAALDDKQHQQIMKAMPDHPSILRTQYAIALLRDRNADQAAERLRAFEAAAKKHAFPAEAQSEREIIAAINAALQNGGNA